MEDNGRRRLPSSISAVDDLSGRVESIEEKIAPKAFPWKTLIPWTAGVILAAISLTVWALTTLSAKANVIDVTDHAKLIQEHEVRIIHLEDNNKWMAQTLYEMARHQGVLVTPPPAPMP